MNPVRLPIVIFVLILIPLLGWGMDLWLHPKYPSRVKGENIVPQTARLEILNLTRKPYTRSSTDTVTRLNLFREERKPYQKPKPQVKMPVQVKKPPVVIPPKPVKPKQPVSPPPKVKLTGVVLHGNFRVAFFEGTYTESLDNGQTRTFSPRKKGYKVGEFMGEYQIKTIDKDRVVMSSLRGQQMTLRLLRKAPTGTSFKQTGKSTLKPRIKRRTTIKKRKITPSGFKPGQSGWFPSSHGNRHHTALFQAEWKGWDHA